MSSHSCHDSSSSGDESTIPEQDLQYFQLKEAFFALIKDMKIQLEEDVEWTIKDEIEDGDAKMIRLCRMFIRYKKWPIMVEIVRYCESLRFIDFN